MFDHVKFGASDYVTSRVFSLQTLTPLGVTPAGEGEPTYGAELADSGDASLCLCQSVEKPASLHIAFCADSREQVDTFWQAALAIGGKDNGASGVRPNHYASYYAVFVIVPDGHNIEAVCHLAG